MHFDPFGIIVRCMDLYHTQIVLSSKYINLRDSKGLL